MKSLQEYHRRVKLETFFEGKKNKKEKKPPFTHGSDWYPALSRLPKVIASIIRADWYAYRHLNWGFVEKQNLTVSEQRALKQLRENIDIVIKPADKGNAVVLMDIQDYIFEGTRQLQILDHYSPLSEPIYPQTQIEVREILEEMYEKELISGKQKEYLLGPGIPRPRRFYLLPKIHKKTDSWTVPHKIPPGRPIVSDCDSETYHTAEFVEYHLNAISQKHQSYLKDTYDFISKTKNLVIPSNAFLFTIDVDSLYTNIETQAGMEAVRNCMKKYPDPKRPDEYVLKLLEINLTKNDFEFNDKFYLQTKGTAMGKTFAPSYANIFMACWEEAALDSHPLKPYAYYRFLDDIWGIWVYSKEDFECFIKHLNQHQRSIKVKFEIDSTQINFLDVVTYKGPKFLKENKLDYRVYFKETDTHCLLHRHSFHPRHTFRGILKSQLLRFHRICSQEREFGKAVKILFRALRTRGYSRSMLQNTLKSFRRSLHNTVNSDPEAHSKDKIIPFVAFYSTQCRQLNSAIKQNFSKFLTGTDYLQRHKPIAAYKRNKNLLDLLVQSKVYSKITKEKQVTCKYFVPLKWVKNKTTKQIFTLQQTLSPQITNCVYLIFCMKCKKQYVGQTKNELRVRAYQHAHNILHKIEKRRHVVQHFLMHGLTSLKITGLQANPLWDLRERLKTERFWIKRLDTLYPRGLNEA